MVQQGLKRLLKPGADAPAGGAAGGERRTQRERRAERERLAGADAGHPAAQAACRAGLKASSLVEGERREFLAATLEYLEARNAILLRWEANPTRFLPEEECVAAASAGHADMARRAYRWLSRHGAINLGVLQGDPRVPLPPALQQQQQQQLGSVEAAAAAAQQTAAVEQAAGEGASADAEGAAAAAEGEAELAAVAAPAEEISQEALAEQLFVILEGVEMQTTTEKQLRRQLGEHFGVDVSDRKQEIRELVTAYLAAEGPPEYVKKKAAAQQAAKEKAAAEARERAAAERAKQQRGRVVVIGAGPAGLTAALHLKRHGVEVIVLEARERVGGRVHSYQGGGLGAPVDLGASIITGTEPDPKQHLRPDPSALLCRQLGIRLHVLDPDRMPLLDTATGEEVPQELDTAAQRLVDELMDDVADELDEMSEEDKEKASYGQLLQRALAQRAERGAAAAAAATAAAAAAAAVTAAAAAAVTAAEAAAAAAPTGAAAEAGATAAAAAGAVAGGGVDEAAAASSPWAGLPSLLEIGLSQEAWRQVEEELQHPEQEPLLVGQQQPQEPAPEVDDFVASLLASPAPSSAAAQPEEPAVLLQAAAVSAAPVGEESVSGAGAEEAGVLADAADAAATAAAKAAAGAAAEDALQPSVPAPPPGGQGEQQAVGGSAGGAGPVAHEEQQEEEGEGEAPPQPVTEEQLRVLHWHWANLEYGCSARLSDISAPHWNQDEEFGGFGGAHCMVVGGYARPFEALASLLDVRLGTPAAEVRVTGGRVEVVTAGGETLACDAVVVAVPLGVLKAGALRFQPPLPEWKASAIARLGFGDLNKVVLEFPELFWDDSADFFGAVGEATEEGRGWAFTFWNLHRFSGVPLLAALVSGAAAREAEGLPLEEIRERALCVLRRLFPHRQLPEPVACAASKWASEDFTRGSYSYIAVGASGKDYEQLAQPVAGRIMFAGEHTAREHPDTVGGAMLSGLREAARVLELLARQRERGAEGGRMGGEATEAEGMEVARERKRKGAAEGGGREGRSQGSHAKRPRSGMFGGEEGRRREGRRAEAEQAQQQQQQHEGDVELAAARAMGPDMARAVEGQMKRSAAREEKRQAMRALMQASGGDVAPLRQLLAASEEVTKRQALLEALGGADGKALEAVAADRQILSALAGWVEEAAVSGLQVHLLDLLLRTLRMLPLQPSSAGLAEVEEAVRSYCLTHSDPDSRKLSQELLRAWAAAAAAAEGGGGEASNGGSTGGIPQWRAPPQQQQQWGGSAGASGSDLTVQLGEAGAARLAAIHREAAEASAAAAALALQAEALKQQMEAQGPAVKELGLVKDFELYAQEARREKIKPKAKMERVSERAPPPQQQQQQRQPPIPSSDAIQDPETRTAVLHYVESVLRPIYKEGRLGKEDFKRVRTKAVAKVLAVGPAPTPGQQFLTSKRKRKIETLVGEFIKLSGGK